MTRQRFGWGLALAAVLVVGSACERTETPEMAPQSDEAITTNIQARYFGDPEIKAYDVDVDTEDGVVTLSGTVETESARAQAVALAQQVEGVGRVQDDLRVEPPMTADADALVDADADELASRDADSAAATNQAAAPDRDDGAEAAMRNLDDQVNAGWITMKIQAQYFGDQAVKGRRIDVNTSQAGRVTLRGAVQTEAARQRAVEIARGTEGVTGVSDELTVTGGPATGLADAEDSSEDRGMDMDLDLGDPWVTAKIKSKYFLDDEVKGFEIDVTTEDGIVTLTGDVETAAARRQAVALARSTDGVADVRDQLRVTGEMTEAGAPVPMENQSAAAAAPVDDEWIVTRIQSRYFLEDDLKIGEIEVSSDQGDVTIEGEVLSEDAREKAGEIARETSGVAEVVNRLAIAGQVESAIEAPAGQ
jgi:osmotically-inducible protein OsmY